MHVATRFVASTMIACLAGAWVVPAHADVTFCLRNGMRIVAERFETRDGGFLLYVPGATTPLSYPSADVQGINTECGPPPITFGIHGSNTIGERLMPSLVDAFAMKRFATRPTSVQPAPEEQKITLRSGDAVRAVIDFRAHGSGTATPGLLSGQATIGMASRRLNAGETSKIQSQAGKDPLAAGSEHVLALDGLAVIVNAANPVTQLSLDQIGRIFSGAATNWREFGGPDRSITVLRRDDKSGTYDTFKSLVLEPGHLTVSPSARKFESSEELSATVAKDVSAIGFVAVPYIDRNIALRISSACGLSSGPSKFAIKSEEYPLARRLYLYTLGEPSEPVVRDLLNFTLSDEAQHTVVDNGFIDQSVEFQAPDEQNAWAGAFVAEPTAHLPADHAVSRGAIDAFRRIVARSSRSTVVFRFASGSSQLDTRALQDIQRLSQYLRSGTKEATKAHLVGFADSNGSWDANERLARERVDSVARLLEAAGVVIPASGRLSLAYFAPVACNDGDAGRAKNRRVEVWIER